MYTPLFYYTLMCEEVTVYKNIIVTLTATVMVICLVLFLDKRLQTYKYVKVRAAMLIFLGSLSWPFEFFVKYYI